MDGTSPPSYVPGIPLGATFFKALRLLGVGYLTKRFEISRNKYRHTRYDIPGIGYIKRGVPSGTPVMFMPNPLYETFDVPGIKHRYRIRSDIYLSRYRVDLDSDIDTQHKLRRLPRLQRHQKHSTRTRRSRLKAGKRRARLHTREHTTQDTRARVVFGKSTREETAKEKAE